MHRPAQTTMPPSPVRSIELAWLVVLLFVSPARAGAVDASGPVSPGDLTAIERDDAAAEKAAEAGDVRTALKYFDYFGHEQEAFAKATVEYRRARHTLRTAVTDKFGRPAWRRAAASLGSSRRGRDRRRSARREGDVVYVRDGGARHETPYVRDDGVWKVSVREVLLLAVRARIGKDVEYEEADLHVLAGKMAGVLGGRAERLRSIAESVRSGRIGATEQLEQAIKSVRGGGS